MRARPKMPVSRAHSIALVATLVLGCSRIPPREPEPAPDLSGPIRKELEAKLSPSGQQEQTFCNRELLCGPRVLFDFYEGRSFRPAWSDGTGPLPLAESLVLAVKRANREGLRPEDYRLPEIEALLADLAGSPSEGWKRKSGQLVDLDLLLTDTFLVYGSHLLTGRVNPETLHAKWFVKGREADLSEALQSALETGNIEKALRALLPSHTVYTTLKTALSDYREIMQAGGWPQVPVGPYLREGDRGERIVALRFRLTASGDISGAPTGGGERVLDRGLKSAVRRFQQRHGLRPDGVVGPATIAALNIPVEARLREIELNMERWRWLPHELGKRYILVNTANFGLDVVEKDRVVMSMRVVAGKRARRSPVFSGRMTYLVVNPYWNIPHKIAVKDILPRAKMEPQYLTRERILVFESWRTGAPEIDPQGVDWALVTPRNLTFRLRQDPGPWNALGRVKFMFPNKFAVYLHDTPSQHLFRETRRDFSSGCIRIEKPIDLAEYVLRGHPQGSTERIVEAIESGKRQEVILPKPIPIHLLYWTAWVDRTGTLHFRDDVYDRDEPLDLALREQPPGL